MVSPPAWRGGAQFVQNFVPISQECFFANSTPGTVDAGLKGFITSHLCDYKHGTDALRQNCQFTLTPAICSACNGAAWRMVIGDRVQDLVTSQIRSQASPQ